MKNIAFVIFVFFGICLSNTGLANTNLKNITTYESAVKMYAFRLHPGDDLVANIENFIVQHHIRAAAIVTVVGSLTTAKIRFANQPNTTELKGHFEIVSMTGTAGCKNVNEGHYHITIANEKGQTIGGHTTLGNIVYTTAEIVIADLKNLEFVREIDPETTYDELAVHPTH